MKEHDLGKLYERSQRLSHIIGQRKDLVNRIGYGETKVGSSMDQTLRVGRVRKRVIGSVERFSSQFEEINKRLSYKAKREAKEFRRELKLRKRKLTEIASLVKEGHLKKEHLKTHQQELREFEVRLKNEPWLRKALKDLDREKRRQEIAQSVPELTLKEEKPSQETAEEIIEESRQEKSGRSGPRPKLFDLPNGGRIGGKAGLLLSLAERHSPTNLLTIEEAVRIMYQTDPSKASIRKFREILVYARKVIKNEGLELIEVKDQDSRGIFLKRGEIIPPEETPDEQKQPTQEEPKLEFIDTSGIPTLRTDITITLETIDGVLTWKPRELVPYSKLNEEIAGLRQLIESFRSGERTIPTAKNFLGNLDYEEKINLATRALQGMIVTTIAKDLEKLGQRGLSHRLGIQINQLKYFLGEPQGRDIIVKALECLPTLQRIILYRALSTNVKEQLDHPDLNECDETQFAIYIMHATWPKLKYAGFDNFEQRPVFDVKPEQANLLEKLLVTAFERSCEGDLSMGQIIDIIRKNIKNGDYLLYTIKKIAEIGGFSEAAYHFFQDHSSTRALAMQISRSINEDTLVAEEE